MAKIMSRITLLKGHEIYDGLAIKELKIVRLACSYKFVHCQQKII